MPHISEAIYGAFGLSRFTHVHPNEIIIATYKTITLKIQILHIEHNTHFIKCKREKKKNKG